MEEFASAQDFFRPQQFDHPPVARWRQAEDVQARGDIPQAFRRQVAESFQFRVVDVGVDNSFPERNDVLFVEFLPGVKPSDRMGMADIYGDEGAALGHDPVEHIRVIGNGGRQVFQGHGYTVAVPLFDEEGEVVYGAPKVRSRRRRDCRALCGLSSAAPPPGRLFLR